MNKYTICNKYQFDLSEEIEQFIRTHEHSHNWSFKWYVGGADYQSVIFNQGLGTDTPRMANAVSFDVLVIKVIDNS